ncbi:NADAR family protein [Lentzea alba]|uniref:NADAR family protein n=1 Tax=Lentzea alba TaxID=2714351 RepID=UPI0039BEE16E
MKYLFFWGHQPERDGSVGKGCLSQWWPCVFEVDGVTFASAEHYMMWRKALLFDDTAVASRVLAAASPAEAKALGREVSGFDDEVWVSSRLEIVVAGNLAKFGQDPALRSYLLNTGSRVLVEASPQDRVWGIGLVASDPRASDPSSWLGLNLLGEALMEVRSRLSAA